MGKATFGKLLNSLGDFTRAGPVMWRPILCVALELGAGPGTISSPGGQADLANVSAKRPDYVETTALGARLRRWRLATGRGAGSGRLGGRPAIRGGIQVRKCAMGGSGGWEGAVRAALHWTRG